jgi:hypothetical protein
MERIDWEHQFHVNHSSSNLPLYALYTKLGSPTSRSAMLARFAEASAISAKRGSTNLRPAGGLRICQPSRSKRYLACQLLLDAMQCLGHSRPVDLAVQHSPLFTLIFCDQLSGVNADKCSFGDFRQRSDSPSFELLNC